jgi:hypothetical protein
VEDLEPVFRFLKAQNAKQAMYWQSRYMTILWLSLLCIVPFDLKIVDSQALGEERSEFVDRMIATVKTYLSVASREREAAAYILAKLVTRPDTVKTHLPKFMEECLRRLEQGADQFTTVGLLMTLCFIYKFGPREALASTAGRVLENLNILDNNVRLRSDQLVRKLRMKLISRLGTSILSGRVAAWRYVAGKRKLTENLTSKTGVKTEGNASAQSTEVAVEQPSDYNIPAELEDIVELIIQGLKEKVSKCG